MQSLRLMWFYHFHSILRCPFFVYIRSMYLQNIICTYLFRLFGLFSQLGESNHKICIALCFKVKASHSEIRWSSLFIAQTAHRIAARTKSTEFSNFSEVPMMIIQPYADRLLEHQPPAHWWYFIAFAIIITIVVRCAMCATKAYFTRCPTIINTFGVGACVMASPKWQRLRQ